MRVKSLSIALALTVALSTSAFARVQQKRIDPRNPEINPIEWVVRAVKKIVRAFEQPIMPIPSAPTTGT